MNTSANAFFPRGITIKNQEGTELDLGAWRRKDAPASSIVENSTPPIRQTHKKRITVVRMESVEAKEKRLAEQKEKDEMLRKAYGRFLWSFNGLAYENIHRGLICPARGGPVMILRSEVNIRMSNFPGTHSSRPGPQ